MTTKITMEEWLAAVREPEPVGYTSRQIAEALGYSYSHFRCNVRAGMLKAGVLRKTGCFRRGKSRVDFYELILPQKRDSKLLDVGVALSARRPRGRELSELVAQLPSAKKKKGASS